MNGGSRNAPGCFGFRTSYSTKRWMMKRVTLLIAGGAISCPSTANPLQRRLKRKKPSPHPPTSSLLPTSSSPAAMSAPPHPTKSAFPKARAPSSKWTLQAAAPMASPTPHTDSTVARTNSSQHSTFHHTSAFASGSSSY